MTAPPADEITLTPLVIGPGAIGRRRPCLLALAGPRLGEVFAVDNELVIGRGLDTQLRLGDDEGVSRRHARVSFDGTRAVITDLGSVNGVFVDGERIKENDLHSGMKIRIGQTTVLRFVYLDEMEERAQRQLLDSVLRDPLTGAFNRHYLLLRLAAELRFAERHQQLLALILFDIDRFRAVNDRVGLAAGDAVLKRLVELLRGALRSEDLVARYDGQRFAVLVRHIGERQAVGLGDRLRRQIGRSELGTSETPVAITLSVGVSLADPTRNCTTAELLGAAEGALLSAQQAGRNCVVAATP